MPNPLENELLLYYMSGIGGALGGPGSVAESVGGMTQQQIQSQNFMKLMKTLIEGGGKYSMDGKGININAPPGAFSKTDLSIPGFPDTYSKDSGADWFRQMQGLPSETGGQRQVSKGAYPSPSSSPLDVGGADLAGLTPENISQALQLKFAKEEIGRKTTADLVRAGYYGAATKKMAAETAALDRPFIEGFTLEQFKALTPGDREYALAKRGAEALGDTEFMTKREWEETKPTERQRFLKGLEDRPELLGMEKQLADARRAVLDPKPTPVNWTTATRELNKRFGKLDPTGMWAVTPELQATHRKAQELLVDFKDAKMDPLRAVNKAETQAREWKDAIEKNYFARVAEAQRVKDKTDRERRIGWIKGEFYRQYKYMPSDRRL